ncbi:hypothetical protein GF345_06245 [Candidatus Woesearchaeota archaeon]|nr:hypothetical protein [Candidatus Woesearchaeota archaeon]
MDDSKNKAIREWVQEQATKNCPKCIDNCCSGVRHKISFKEGEDISLLTDTGVNVYQPEDLNQDSVKEWLSSFYTDDTILNVIRKSGEPIEQPALIKHLKPSQGLTRICFDIPFEHSLYGDKCPLYDSKSGCTAYDDPRRFEVCKSYPVYARPSKDSLIVDFYDSCKIFGSQSMREKFRRQFPEPEVRLGFFKDDKFIYGPGNDKTLNELEYGRKADCLKARLRIK